MSRCTKVAGRHFSADLGEVNDGQTMENSQHMSWFVSVLGTSAGAFVRHAPRANSGHHGSLCAGAWGGLSLKWAVAHGWTSRSLLN